MVIFNSYVKLPEGMLSDLGTLMNIGEEATSLKFGHPNYFGTSEVPARTQRCNTGLTAVQHPHIY